MDDILTEEKPLSQVLEEALNEAIKTKQPMERIQEFYAAHVLALNGWNKSKAAKALNVTRRTIIRWEDAWFNSEIGQCSEVG